MIKSNINSYFTHTGVRFSITDACFFLYLQNLFQHQLLLKKLKPRNYE